MIKNKTKTTPSTVKKEITPDISDSFLKSLIKASGNELASLMSEETLSNTTDWLDTGSFALNGVISSDIFKGIPNNKVIGLAGPESTGKTFLVLSIAKIAVEKGYAVAFFDSENSTEKEMLVKRDMDPSKFMYYPIDTVQNFKTQMIKIINKYNESSEDKRCKLLIILDSLGNLSTTKEIDDAETGSDKKDMTRAGQIKSVFRVLQLKLARAKVPMLVTNHVYDVIGSYVPTKEMGGGCLTNKELIQVINTDGKIILKSINGITKGDCVRTIFGNEKVLNTFHYKKPVIKLTLQTGETIECTKQHKFLIQKGDNLIWKTANTLHKNDEIIALE